MTEKIAYYAYNSYRPYYDNSQAAITIYSYDPNELDFSWFGVWIWSALSVKTEDIPNLVKQGKMKIVFKEIFWNDFQKWRDIFEKVRHKYWLDSITIHC